MSAETEIRAALAAGPTPGPWNIGPIFDNDYQPERIINALDNSAVVAVTLDFGKNNPTFRDANALLIAAFNPANITALLAEMDALRIDAERCKTLFDVAMNTLSQIASTPRNKGARKNARATELFIQTQSDAAITQFKKGASA